MNPMLAASIDLEPGLIPSCQICLAQALEPIVDLGHNALCDSPLTPDQLNDGETVYPLRLVRCGTCGLIQIDYCVRPDLLFHADYPYLSGITPTLRANLHGIAHRAADKLGLAPGRLVVDIGSNDGTLLEGFKSAGMRVLGVEATNIANIANAKGIKTIHAFFNAATAQQVRSTEGPAAVVTATNIFAHVNHLGTLLRGIHSLLDDDGVFISESHYLVDILETLQYDSIYHEHLRYYSLRPLVRLFEEHGFTLIDAERIPNYGGSIRVYAQKGLGHAVHPQVHELIAMEDRAGLYRPETYVAFAHQVRSHRRALRSLLVRLADEGRTVVGIGSPGRSATLLTYCGVSPDLLPYVAEQSTCLKVGLFTPGTHIPIVDEERMFAEQPDFGLLLSWHYAKDIIRNLRKKGLRSKIIVPLPTIQIVEGEL